MIQPLTFKCRKAIPAHRLPYVGRQHHSDESDHIGFWDVPLTGGYSGGLKTGKGLALIALKFISTTEDAGDGGHLKDIAAAWIDRASLASPDELDVLTAQVMGFMSAIGSFTRASAVTSRLKLAQVDDKAALKKANEGLGFKAPERKRSSPLGDDASTSNADSIKV